MNAVPLQLKILNPGPSCIQLFYDRPWTWNHPELQASAVTGLRHPLQHQLPEPHSELKVEM